MREPETDHAGDGHREAHLPATLPPPERQVHEGRDQEIVQPEYLGADGVRENQG